MTEPLDVFEVLTEAVAVWSSGCAAQSFGSALSESSGEDRGVLSYRMGGS